MNRLPGRVAALLLALLVEVGAEAGAGLGPRRPRCLPEEPVQCEQCRGYAGRSTETPRETLCENPKGREAESGSLPVYRCPGAGTCRDPGDREAPRPLPCSVLPFGSPAPPPAPTRVAYFSSFQPLSGGLKSDLYALYFPFHRPRGGPGSRGGGLRGGVCPGSDAGAESAGSRAVWGRSGWAAGGSRCERAEM